MSISSITGAALVPSSTADSAAGSGVTPRGSSELAAGTRANLSSATSEYVAFVTTAPSRFPWLSRLSSELDSAARQKPAFASAPVLGDHVDKSV